MKAWIKRTLIGLAGAGVLFGGFAAWAHRHHHGHGWRTLSEAEAAPMKARVVERVGSKLELDAAQKAKLGVLADRLREQSNALVGPTPDPRAEVRALIGGTSFDRAQATRLIEQKVAAVNAQSPALVAALADFYDALRPDQQARLRELLDRHRRGGPRS
jgi:periplasmic protein CpxP/Spy